MGDLQHLVCRVSNWGRWGEDDQLGTLNLITPEKRVQAARLVRTGEVHSLAIPLDRNGPLPHHDRRFNPRHWMLETGADHAAGTQHAFPPALGVADDLVELPTHSGAHWDALSHIFHDGQMWNGRPATDVTAHGALANGIEHLAGGGVVTRGVLVDMPRALEVEWLAIDHHVTVAQLERALDRQGVDVGEGDALLIRTGNMFRARRNGGWDRYTHTSEPGLGIDAIPWLHERGVAAVAADTWSFEVVPSGHPLVLPFHVVAIPYMGLLVGEIFDLDGLAAACAEDGRWDFLFTAPPLPLTGAVGSPVNPLAIR